MQAPDEILMVVCDTSASMRNPSDFDEVNDDIAAVEQVSAVTLTEPEFYNRNTFDDMKELMCKHESFDDMVAIIAEAPFWRRTHASQQVFETLRTILGDEIIRKQKDLESRRARSRFVYNLRHGLRDLETQLERAKGFFAGLQTFQQPICDFMLFRATTGLSDEGVSRTWKWSIGEQVPAGSANTIPSLPAEVTEIPDQLLCPISHAVMQDAVQLSDGHSYSRSAITVSRTNAMQLRPGKS